MKRPGFLSLFLILAIIIVGVACGCLYHQNMSYKNQNRQLILQNDSILSVNLELSNLREGRTVSVKQ